MHKRIAKIRQDNKMTQSKFGQKLGVTRDVISNFENARVEPKPLFIDHLCNVFNVNKEWLKNGKGEMYNSSNKDLGALLALYDNLSLNNIVKKLAMLNDEYLNLVEHLVNTLSQSQKKD